MFIQLGNVDSLMDRSIRHTQFRWWCESTQSPGVMRWYKSIQGWWRDGYWSPVAMLDAILGSQEVDMPRLLFCG